MGLLRLTIAFVAAVAFTSTLFWFLRTMVGAHVDIESLRPTARIEFSRLRRDSDVQSRREVKPKLEAPIQAPSAPVVAGLGVGAGAGVAGGVSTGPVGAMPGWLPGVGAVVGSMQKGGVIGGGSDRDVTPLVRIEPEYPMQATRRGVEGWVLVGFTITAQGTVKDPVVVDAEPKGVFDEAVRKAVSNWKYNPKIVDGVAVERRGVQVIIRFALEKNPRDKKKNDQ
jgi:protein TonB